MGKKLISILKEVHNSETLTVEMKQMTVGFMIANTGSEYPVSKIAKIIKAQTTSYVYEVIFANHKQQRDNNSEYRDKYFEVCKRMGVKNRA